MRQHTKSRSLKDRTFWNTEGALAMMAGGPDETKGELSVCMRSGFQADLEPTSQSVADVERSKYKVACQQEAIRIVLDGHKTTGTYEAATPPQGRKPVGAKWVFTYKTDGDGLIMKTNARLVAKGFS